MIAIGFPKGNVHHIHVELFSIEFVNILCVKIKALYILYSGLALLTRSSPDVKEAYGKMKKEEKVVKEGKPMSPTRSTMLPLEFNCIAFPKVDGDRLLFFRTHVKPGMCMERLSLSLWGQSRRETSLLYKSASHAVCS